MEIAVRDYIKNMFAVDTRPEWDSSYEGVILFEKSNHIFVCGDSFGWIELPYEE